LIEGDFLAVKINNTNTANVMMTVNALTAYPVYRNDGLPLIGRDLGALGVAVGEKEA
jgi:hypothetical protein